MSAPRALHPFVFHDYRVLTTAMVISVFGLGLWAVAMVYQVIRLGGGPAELSLVAALGAAGLVGFVLLGGIAADRFAQRSIIIAVELLHLAVVSAVAFLGLTGQLQIWQLSAASFLLGAGAAFFFPAYSAYLPRILPPGDLLAANGLEGTIRPVLQQAAGPAAGGLIAGSFSPAHAIAAMALCHAASFVVLNLLAKQSAPEHRSGQPKTSVLHDLKEGVAYTVKTPWLLWTLLWAVLFVLLFIGPIEVLLPFLVREQLGGGVQTFGFLLATWGVGGAAGAMVTASLPLPRRYLTVMMLAWGLGTLPLAGIGLGGGFWIMAAILFVVGFGGSAGQVIWGTLLQRRVPPHLLGRISSLDFFVSLALMPLSMALAGPVGEVIPLWLVFLIVGLSSPVLAAAALLLARMPRDELAHPLEGEGQDGGLHDLDDHEGDRQDGDLQPGR